ncbi:MAG: ccr4 associated factor [Bogoriella megaspora]|nr:MAG: ccr4 associated factor [Bogoriella megaspora]
MLLNSSRPYICLRCLSGSSRSFSASAHYFRPELRKPFIPPYPAPSGCVELPRRVISLHGDDAPKFLQGLITANVAPPSSHPQSPFYTAFLSAQGRVLYDAFIYPMIGPRPKTQFGDDQWPDILGYDSMQEHGYLIDVDGQSASSLLTHLKRHKLRAKVKVRLLDEDDVEMWSTWHGDSDQPTHERYPSPPISQMLYAADTRAAPLGRQLFAHRYMVPQRNCCTICDFNHLGEVEPADYNLRRYFYGVPEGQDELQYDSALPHQSNIDLMGGIDFRKGCYVGQELTIRTQHTGVVRRRILPIQLYDKSSAEPPSLEYNPDWKQPTPPKDASMSKVDSKGRSIGKFLSGIGNIGLGLCRIEAMTDVAVSAEGATFKAGDRFKVTWEGDEGSETGVKAFVPEWLKSRLPEVKPARRVD